MSIHKVFASNLRERCQRLGTIADVCKGSSVNRQQFNRYLSGAALPNARTLARICQHLGIREEELFMENRFSVDRDPQYNVAAKGISWIFGVNTENKFSGNEIRRDDSNDHANDHPVTIADGYYFCYFPLQNLKGLLVRSVVKINRKGNNVVFRRLTLFLAPGGTRRVLVYSKHSGIVAANRECHYFLGRNINSDHGVSLLVTERREVDGTKLYRGLGIVQGSASPMACQVCLERIPKASSAQDIRKAIKSLGIFSSESKDINPLISALFGLRTAGPLMQISIPDLETALHQITPIIGASEKLQAVIS